MPIPGTTQQSHMLEATSIVGAGQATTGETAIILHMGSKLLLLVEVELATDLPVGTHHAIALVVEVGEEEGATPTVGLKHLDGGGYALSRREVFIEQTTEVIVQLYVLGKGQRARQESRRED